VSNVLDWLRADDAESPRDAVFYGIFRTANGKDEEDTLDLIRRAPDVLRHRGVPCTASDWQQLVRDCDPLGRIAHCAVREGFFPFGYPPSWGKGVQVAFHCYGPAEPAVRLTHHLAPEIERLLEMVRPLGTGFSVLRTVLIKGTLRFSPPVGKEIDQSTERLIKKLIWEHVNLDLAKPGPKASAQRQADPQPFQIWQRFRASFEQLNNRPRTHQQLMEESIGAYFTQSNALVTLGPFSFTFQDETAIQPDPHRDWPIPWVLSPDDIKLRGEP
jgi:hypothetical protein